MNHKLDTNTEERIVIGPDHPLEVEMRQQGERAQAWMEARGYKRLPTGGYQIPYRRIRVGDL